MTKQKLTGKLALVTGAGAGIGASIAEELALNGATVVINYRNDKQRAETLVADIAEQGGKAHALQADVEQQDSVAAMLDTIEQTLAPIDILVLNAGPPAYWSLFVDDQQEAFENKLLSELRGVFIPARLVAKQMAERGSGSIIGLSSILARKTTAGFGAHAVVKAAIEAQLKNMALELGPAGVRVNIVAPSLARTPGSSWVPEEVYEATASEAPLGRLCTPEDIAKVVAMVASDDAAFVSGAYIPVNGGLLST